MRATFLIVAFSAAFAAAAAVEPRGLGDFPKCALPCLVKAPHGTCKATDFKCLCHNSKFIASSTKCIKSKCKGADIKKAQSAQAKTCKGK